MTRLGDRTPAQVFATITDGWPVAEVPVIMAGMVGSNAGWLAVPYLACPVALNALSDRLTCVEGKAWIVPGLSIERDDNYNVMRGEKPSCSAQSRCSPRRCMSCRARTPSGCS